MNYVQLCTILLEGAEVPIFQARVHEVGAYHLDGITQRLDEQGYVGFSSSEEVLNQLKSRVEGGPGSPSYRLLLLPGRETMGFSTGNHGKGMFLISFNSAPNAQYEWGETLLFRAKPVQAELVQLEPEATTTRDTFNIATAMGELDTLLEDLWTDYPDWWGETKYIGETPIVLFGIRARGERAFIQLACLPAHLLFVKAMNKAEAAEANTVVALVGELAQQCGIAPRRVRVPTGSQDIYLKDAPALAVNSNAMFAFYLAPGGG